MVPVFPNRYIKLGHNLLLSVLPKVSTVSYRDLPSSCLPDLCHLLSWELHLVQSLLELIILPAFGRVPKVLYQLLFRRSKEHIHVTTGPLID